VGALRQQPARELAGVDIESPYHSTDLPDGAEARIDKILARAESRWLKRMQRMHGAGFEDSGQAQEPEQRLRGSAPTEYGHGSSLL